ncbi:hypothetical protein DFJ58DRAFT_844197 [Suillus subalutaceus]|uniref:uncharacterized protein n=1 Tax=Suillus subalutaceus TaxID=48586 RepID=UPI001B8759F7|nr:uncharacterized protein DFJ58DRAFT_844197 [Suillus subalutaceus]KAG1843769.1 hypothetical protein DFJ58DRAFT_844197 [Suillus subalutaceus]
MVPLWDNSTFGGGDHYELLEPAEEKQIGDSLGFDLNGGDMTIVVAGEVIEADSDDDSEEDHDAAPEVSRVEALALCQRLEGACLQHGHSQDSTHTLDLLKQIRRFCVQLQCEELLHVRQTTLDSFCVRWVPTLYVMG